MSGADPRSVSDADRRPDSDEPEDSGFLRVIGLVALTVAVVILVFFGIGYLLGRLFL